MREELRYNYASLLLISALFWVELFLKRGFSPNNSVEARK